MLARLIALGILTVALHAQSLTPSDIDSLIHNVRSAIDRDDFATASDISAKLNDAVEQRLDTWLIRDVNQRVDEVLTWLPEDTETLLVYQKPFVINAKDSLAELYAQPARLYTTDRLMALNGGKLYATLAGVTVRFVAAGASNIRDRFAGFDGTATPTPMPNAQAAYFYFLADDLDATVLGTPAQTIGDNPVWVGTASFDAGASIPGRERPVREDATWLALARPNLLVVTSSSELLGQILQRIARPSRTRALSSELPEWVDVDRTANFWALRHYSEPGDRHDLSNPTSKLNPQRQRDSTAIGVTVKFDAGSNAIEIRYLSDAPQLPRFIDGPPTPQFKTEQIRAGLWRVTSNIHERGAYPFHVAARLLGFGEYR